MCITSYLAKFGLFCLKMEKMDLNFLSAFTVSIYRKMIKINLKNGKIVLKKAETNLREYLN